MTPVTSASGYNVCLPQPEGYEHSFCLLELAELISFSLQDLGHDTTFRINDIDTGRRNIIVGCHLVDSGLMSHVPADTVVINSEQIYDEDPFEWNRNIFEWAGNFETWDYSPRNVAAFAQRGLPDVKLLRIGHQPQLSRIEKADEPDIDVLFYGSMTDRREVVFEQIRQRGLNLVTLFAVYGAERDAYIARSKVVLNMHNHAAQIFEVVRVHYLLSNAVAVVSEVNPETSVSDFYSDAVAGAPYESLADECARLAGDDAARLERQRLGYEAIARHPQTVFTAELLS